jgi:hypothetical protein
MTARALAVLLLLCSAAGADTLVLRNGNRITGRWWATDADLVHFLVNGHLERYARSEVSEVVFGDGASTPAAPATAPEPAPAAVARAGTPEVVLPELTGVIYFQDGLGNLVPVERTIAVEHRGTTGFNTRTPSRYWEMAGARSLFRLRADTPLHFAIELPAGISPAVLKLYPLESKGGVRRTKAAAVRPPEIPVNLRRVGGRVYIYTVVGGLAPGEYAFSPSTSNDSFCFGIDALTGR